MCDVFTHHLCSWDKGSLHWGKVLVVKGSKCTVSGRLISNPVLILLRMCLQLRLRWVGPALHRRLPSQEHCKLVQISYSSMPQVSRCLWGTQATSPATNRDVGICT